MRADAAVWSRKAKAFWEARQNRSGPGRLTGYLLDESPPSIGRHRFEGEWGRVKRWLQVRVPQRQRCLDVGCGTGVWLSRFAGEFGSVEGWDFSPAMARACRGTIRSGGIGNAKVFCGQVSERKGSSVFDFIFVGGVLMYTPDPELELLLGALARLLKPGGLLLLRETTCRDGLWMREGSPLRPGLLAGPGHADGPDYVAVYREKRRLCARLEAAGLRVAEVLPNRHYKLSDLVEDRLRSLDRLSGARLKGDAARAEMAAEWIQRTRLLSLYPEYFVRQVLGWRPWRLENDWFLCDRRTSSTWNER